MPLYSIWVIFRQAFVADFQRLLMLLCIEKLRTKQAKRGRYILIQLCGSYQSCPA